MNEDKMPAWKRLTILGVCLMACGLVILLARPMYRHWKEKRFVENAETALATNDWKNASLSARQALTLNSKNPAATLVMAQLATRARNPGALTWWRQMVELQPSNISNRLELARTAFALGDVNLASTALREIPETGRDSASYHEMAALIALRENRGAEAEQHFAKAAEMDPKNPMHSFNRAVLQLQSSDASVVSNAAKTVEQMADDPVLRHDALRNLTMSALVRHDFAQALSFAERLAATTNAVMGDQLLRLDVLKASTNGTLAQIIDETQSKVGTNAAQICELSNWLINAGRTDETWKWLQTLPGELRTNAPVAVAVSDALAAKKDWKTLQMTLQPESWRGMEFLRHAQLARAATELKSPSAAKAEWNSAMKDASDRVPALFALFDFARARGWNDEQESALLRVLDRQPQSARAFVELTQLYYVMGDSRRLLKFYNTFLQRDPGNLVLKNNSAALSLLLNDRRERAEQTAKDIYDKQPTNALVASTYAFALHLQNQTSKGLEVLEKLPLKSREIPAVALYYGLLLSASGQQEQALHFLELGKRAPLLPEEKRLVAEAEAKGRVALPESPTDAARSRINFPGKK